MELSLLILPLTLVIFVAIIVIIRLARKDRVDPRLERRQRLGFSPLNAPPPGLVERIQALQPNQTDQLRLTRLSQKKSLAGDLYLYDAEIISSNSDSNLEDHLVAVSPALRLPRFSIFQLPGMEGKWGNLMSDLAGGVIGWTGNFTGMKRVQLAGFDQMERKLVLLAEDEEQMRAFFDPDRLRIFAALDPALVVSAAGDSFEIMAMNAFQKSADERMEMEVAAALKLMQSLGG